MAAEAHLGQAIPGREIPYLSHVGAVAMEVSWAIAARIDSRPVARPTLAIQCALLHDVVEDTAVTLEQIAARFGDEVARGVAALTKNPAVGDKAAQMRDSLERIRQCPPEVWMVKLADRIQNLREPPSYWSATKIRGYRDEALTIHAALGEACPVLGPRLLERIGAYAAFADRGA